MKKILILLSVFMIVLVGCNANKPPGEEIKITTWAGGEELAEFQAICDKVSAASNGEYYITVESIPSDYAVKLQTQASSGTLPDIMWMEPQQLASYASAEAIQPINSYVAASPVMANYTFMDDTTESLSYGGELYAIPFAVNPMILYYNKDIVSAEDEVILEATNSGDYMTLDEFAEMARKYHDPENGKYGAMIAGWPPLEYFLWNFGATVEDASGNPTFNSLESIAAIEYLNEILITDPISPPKSIVDAAGQEGTFQQGGTAFLFGGLSDKVETLDGQPVGFEIGYAQVPGDVTVNWTAGLAMSSTTKNPDLTYQVIEDLTLEMWKWKSVPPVEITQLGYASYAEYYAAINPEKAGMAPVVEQVMKKLPTAVYTENSARIYGALFTDVYEAILNGAETKTPISNPQQLLDNAMTTITQGN